MENLEVFKNHSYTDEFIGICFRSYQLPELVYNCKITDYGNNRECFFGYLNGKQTFKGCYISNNSRIEILLPINQDTIAFYNEIILCKKAHKYNFSRFIEYVLKNYPNYLKENISTSHFYNKYKDDVVKISRVFKDFDYKESNLSKKELIKFINDFQKKFENSTTPYWDDFTNRYSFDKKEKFISKDGNINILGFYEYIVNNTDYDFEDCEYIFKGLLINTSYSVSTIPLQALLEYSTHKPEIFKLLKDLIYIKKQIDIKVKNVVI